MCAIGISFVLDDAPCTGDGEKPGPAFITGFEARLEQRDRQRIGARLKTVLDHFAITRLKEVKW